MAAGAGGRADAPAPGVLGFSCLEPRIPEHMLLPRPALFPAPSSGLAELPPLEEDGPEHPAGIRPQTPHPPLAGPASPAVLAACTFGYRARSSTVDGFRPAPPAPGAGSLGSTSGEHRHERTRPLPGSCYPLSIRCSWKELVWGDGGREGDRVGAAGLGGAGGVGCPCPAPSAPGPCEAAGLGHSSPGLGQCPPLLHPKGQAGDPARPACWLLRPQHVKAQQGDDRHPQGQKTLLRTMNVGVCPQTCGHGKLL